MKLLAAQKKKFYNLFKSAQSGFTLIELLVVIGILGILAAALVATIDPFEQLNKASDASVENTLTEFQTALVRYYSIRNTMPWSDASDKCIGGVVATTIDPMVNLGLSIPNCVTTLVTQGELKPAFTTATAQLNQILIAASTSNDVTMCYRPASKAKQKNVNTKFDNTGNLAAANTCKSQTSTGSSCYWCTR